MDSIKETVCAWLDAHAIPYRRWDHAPAASMADCAWVSERVGAMVCKNYFLTTRSGASPRVCTVRPNARLRTSDLSKQAGTSRLAFGSDEEMFRLLRARPGSVSPLGLIFDEAHEARLLMDTALRDEPLLAFHPCDNTATLVLTHEAFFEKFLPAAGIGCAFVEIRDFLEA